MGNYAHLDYLNTIPGLYKNAAVFPRPHPINIRCYDAYAWLRSFAALAMLRPCLRSATVGAKQTATGCLAPEFANLLRKLLLPHVRAGHMSQSLFVQAQSALRHLTLCIKLRTSCNKRLSGIIALILLEVLDEPSGKILCLLFPL